VTQHSTSRPVAQFRRNVRDFYAWLASLVLLGLTPIFAMKLIQHGSLLTRILAVVVGIGGSLPWMIAVGNIIRRGDEFTRRLHLVALAWSFGGALVLLISWHWLVAAEFVRPPDLLVLWLCFLMIWLVALLTTKRHFERER
jgi:hypothetical protein